MGRAGLVERTGRDLMAYRTVIQASDPSSKLIVVMSCFVIYQEKMYDLLAPSRGAVLASSQVLKVVGQPVREGGEGGRGIYVQGLTTRTIAKETKRKKKPPAGAGEGEDGGSAAPPLKTEKSVRGWLMLADSNRRALSRDLKAGDKGLKRAASVTMFEILQLSDPAAPSGVYRAPSGASKRRGRDQSRQQQGAGTERQVLYSSVTFVDLPGAVAKPSDDAVRAKEDMSITKMQLNLSNCTCIPCIQHVTLATQGS